MSGRDEVAPLQVIGHDSGEDVPRQRLLGPPAMQRHGLALAGKSVFTGQDGADRKRGFFLRVRTVKDAAGNIVSANYAKLYGEPLAGPGGFTFQYYYNPNPNDRRLEMDLQRNLQKPVPADDWEEKFNTRATCP